MVRKVTYEKQKPFLGSVWTWKPSRLQISHTSGWWKLQKERTWMPDENQESLMILNSLAIIRKVHGCVRWRAWKDDWHWGSHSRCYSSSTSAQARSFILCQCSNVGLYDQGSLCCHTSCDHTLHCSPNIVSHTIEKPAKGASTAETIIEKPFH